MKQNAKDYTVGERQFILYQFLRKNTRKGKVATKQMIKDHLSLVIYGKKFRKNKKAEGL